MKSKPPIPEERRTRTVVIDDHPFFREGLVGWLNSQAGLVCCGEASSVEEGREAISKADPDLVLLDLQLKTGDGLELLTELMARKCRSAVIVLSRKDEDIYASRAIRAGARGYVMKEEAPETLLAAIRAVLDGRIYVGSNAMTKMVERMSGDGGQGPQDALLELSNRELQVLDLLGRGLTTKSIAAELSVSTKTVDSYRESLKKKLGLADGNALIRAATIWHQEMRPPGE